MELPSPEDNQKPIIRPYGKRRVSVTATNGVVNIAPIDSLGLPRRGASRCVAPDGSLGLPAQQPIHEVDSIQEGAPPQESAPPKSRFASVLDRLIKRPL